MKPPHGKTSSWFTQLDWFLETEAMLIARGLIPRPFDFDPCGHSAAPVSREIIRRGGVVFTKKDNGLKRPWPIDSVPFVNPPYRSEDLKEWVPLTTMVGRAGHPTALLVPAWTDRAWWQDDIELDRVAGRAQVLFLRGRLRFGWPRNPSGKDCDTAKFPSALVVWGRA